MRKSGKLWGLGDAFLSCPAARFAVSGNAKAVSVIAWREYGLY
jgi:hypothetical protein